MKVKIRNISSSGEMIKKQFHPDEMGISEDFIDNEKPIIVQGHLQRVNDFILADLEVIFSMDTVCARCLDSINKEVKLPLEVEFEFKQGDDEIDVGSRVREEILMTHQYRVLCKEDCNGICPDCGAYLNEESCECRNRLKE